MKNVYRFSVQYVCREEIILYTAVRMYGDSGEFITGSAWLLCRHVAKVLHTSHFFTQSYSRATIFSQFFGGTGHTVYRLCFSQNIPRYSSTKLIPNNLQHAFSWSTQYRVLVAMAESCKLNVKGYSSLFADGFQNVWFLCSDIYRLIIEIPSGISYSVTGKYCQASSHHLFWKIPQNIYCTVH